MLREIRRSYNPNIIAIAEPKILISDVRPSFWRSLNMAFIDENYRGSGLRPNLWVACNNNMLIKPTTFLKNEQLIVMKLSTVRGDVYYGFIHASNSYVDRRLLWDSLMPLRGLNLCLMGDFNAIAGLHEQFSRRSMNKISTLEFCQFISDASLIDIETTGPFFIWKCSNVGLIVASRLDRTLVTEGFMDLWVKISVLVLLRAQSDHNPLLLKCMETSAQFHRPFRFQKFWTEYPDFKMVVADSWNNFLVAKDPISVCV